MNMMRRLLGIDYGSKRIGIAVSDPLRIIAQGISVIINSSKAIEQIKNIIQEYDPEKIIVGMPLNLKGEKGAKAQEVEKFIAKLKSELMIDVIFLDERFTSKIAQQTLRDMNVKKKIRQTKGNLDAMSAALILQSYLDSH